MNTFTLEPKLKVLHLGISPISDEELKKFQDVLPGANVSR